MAGTAAHSRWSGPKPPSASDRGPGRHSLTQSSHKPPTAFMKQPTLFAC